MLGALRSIVGIEDEQLRDAALSGMRKAKAWRFAGKPAQLDLAADFFDQIRVHFTPDPTVDTQLVPQIRRWLKPDGTVHFLKTATTESSKETNNRESRNILSEMNRALRRFLQIPQPKEA